MKIKLVLAVVASAVMGLAAGSAWAEEWKDVSIVDAHCAGKMKADADSHTRSCALQCAHYGYGLIGSDGKFVKFDTVGNAKIKAALQASDKADHLRATVDGEQQGNTIKVTSVTLQ